MSPLYRRYRVMLDRTTRKKAAAYPDYGGRGISVCDRWKDFGAFLEDMGSTYRPGLEIDRIDNDGDYEPGNCRWATPQQQARNRRSNHVLTWGGRTMLAIEWTQALGMRTGKVTERLRRGWPLERALTEGVPPNVVAEVLAGGRWMRPRWHGVLAGMVAGWRTPPDPGHGTWCE
jgi:hypothetical protein